MQGGFFKDQIRKLLKKHNFDVDKIHHLRDIYAELVNHFYNEHNIDKSVFK